MEMSSKDIRKTIDELREKEESAKKKEGYIKSATELKAVHDSFVEVGFTETQAWELTKTMFENGVGSSSPLRR